MLRRRPNPVEVDIIGVEWSEHCSYKSSKKYISLLPMTGPRVIFAAGYDAAALDVGDGYVISVHIESHNHPSAIEPYGGAATGVGGVIRDIISIGTRPIAILDALRFGPITGEIRGAGGGREEGRKGKFETTSKSKWLLKNVVSGIGDYGNCIGVPTIGGEVEFDSSFDDYCLVDVASIGLARKEQIIPNKADSGDLIILAGGSTGRDGIHGASFASTVLDDEDNRSAVQIPDPFLEKLLLEATMEAVEHGCVKAMKDLGGGGLSCCLSETADNLKKRFEVDLDNVHTRQQDMSPAEIMISESQERMLYITDSSKLQKLVWIFDKYEIRYAIIGKVKDGSEVAIRYHGKVVASLPANVFAHAPLVDRPIKRPRYLLDRINMLNKRKKKKDKSEEDKNNNYYYYDFDLLEDNSNISEVLLQMLCNPTIASKKWVYSQYDHEVGLRTVVKPGCADASVLRLDNGKFISVKLDGNSKHCHLDPYKGTLGCISESCRNVICTGAEPIGIIDHLQFANPEHPEVFWTFVRAIKAIKDYCKYMNIPVVGGKVSFYNETKKGPIKPSPVIGSIGIIEKESWITGSQIGDGDSIFIIGFTADEMGGSEYYEYCHTITGGVVPNVDLASEKLNSDAMLRLTKNNLVGCVHDCSKGGLGITLAEVALMAQIGATIELDRVPNSCTSLDNLVFSESHSRFIFSTAHPTEVVRMLSKFNGISFGKIGNAHKQDENLIFTYRRQASKVPNIVAAIPLEKLRKTTNSIGEIMNK
jgi:phosphoribosylformylglycinamidine synthase